MASLWSVEGDDVDKGYANIRAGASKTEKELNEHFDAIWAKFEPYADTTFIKQFSKDPDAHFWEMYVGCCLLEDGRKLLTAQERKGEAGLPDICVVDGKKRIWIEAIAPDAGEPGPNQVKGPKPINEGGGFEPAPVRQTQLRMTSALWTKSQVVKGYMDKGLIKADDVRLIAIGAGRFGGYASEDPPTIISSVFPIGDEYVSINKETGEAATGFTQSLHIEKHGAKPIPRTAFLEKTFEHVSGIVWSRAGIGQYSRNVRPLTLVHNPMATKAMEQGWTAWDKEYVTTKVKDGWEATNIKAEKKQV